MVHASSLTWVCDSGRHSPAQHRLYDVIAVLVGESPSILNIHTSVFKPFYNPKYISTKNFKSQSQL